MSSSQTLIDDHQVGILLLSQRNHFSLTEVQISQ